MTTFYTNDPTRNAGAKTTHDQTAEQGGGAGPTGQAKYWSCIAWTAKPVKYYTGATWTTKPLKYWSGTQWTTTPYQLNNI